MVCWQSLHFVNSLVKVPEQRLNVELSIGSNRICHNHPHQPRKVTLMSILYRRFFIVAGIIACMGVLTANIIQQTRRDVTPGEYQSPLISKACADGQLCLAPLASAIAT